MPGSRPSRSEGKSSGRPKRGLRPPPGAQGASSSAHAAPETAVDLDRAAHRRVALGMSVEEKTRPVGLRLRARDEVRDGDGVLPYERLLLHRERCLRLGVAPPSTRRGASGRRSAGARPPRGLEGSSRAPGTRTGAPRPGRTRADTRPGDGARRRWRRARAPRRVARHEAGEPARRPRRSGSRGSRASGTRAGSLRGRGIATARYPRSRGAAGRESRFPRATHRLVPEPTHRERPCRHGMLPDAFHFEG